MPPSPKRREDAAGARRRSRVAQLQQSMARQQLKLEGDLKKQTLIELIEAAPSGTEEQKQRLDGLSTRALRGLAAELKVPQEQVDQALTAAPKLDRPGTERALEDGARPAFEKGSMVILRRGVDKECLDTPGKIGMVVDVQHYCKVKAFDGKTKWYSGAVLKLYEGTTPSKIVLMQAAQRGDLEVIGKCVFSGTDINTKDASGSTAMHYAAGAGQVEALRALIDNHGAIDEPNDKGQTPLFFAATTDTIRLLLQKGADPTRVDAAGRTAAEVLDLPVLPAAKGARKSVSAGPNSFVRSSLPNLPSPRRRGSSVSVRSSMSGVAASTLSLRPPPRRAGGSIARHSWAGDRMPDSLLNIDRHQIGSMELGAFIEQGYTAQQAAADADERARLRTLLCNHMEDALYYAECRMQKMATEIYDKMNTEQSPGEPQKAYLCVYQKEEEDGNELSEAKVKEKFKPEIFTCFKEVKVISEPVPDDTDNERAKSKRDGTAFEVMLQAKSTSDKDVTILWREVKRAIAEQSYVRIYATDVDPSPAKPADSGSSAKVFLGPGGGVLDEQGKTTDADEPPAKLWLTAHSSMNETYAKRFIKALNESQFEMLRAIAERKTGDTIEPNPDALERLDAVAEPLMDDPTENMAKDDIMNASTASEFLEMCKEEYTGVIKKKNPEERAKYKVAQRLFGTFLDECEKEYAEDPEASLDDDEKVKALRVMIFAKLRINDPTEVKQVEGRPGTVECTMTDMDEVLRAKAAFKQLRVPAEDPVIYDEEGKPQRTGRFTITLSGEQDGTEEVAGPLFGLVISQLKPMVPEELEDQIDASGSHIKQSKSRHTERDPNSIKDEVCQKCQKCEADDPAFKDHQCVEGVCKELPRKEGEPMQFNCFTRKKCKDKFGKPRTRLGMLCEACRTCTDCTVMALWDRPGEGDDTTGESKKDQSVDPDENAKGGPFSYLIQVRTAVNTSMQYTARGSTPGTDAGVFVTLIGHRDGEDKPVRTARLKLEHYVGLVRSALEAVPGVATAVVSAKKKGLTAAGTTTVYLDPRHTVGVKPSALMRAIITTKGDLPPTDPPSEESANKMIVAGVGKGRGLTSEVLWGPTQTASLAAGKVLADELMNEAVTPPGPIRLRVDGLKVSQWLEAPTASAPDGEGAFEEGQTSTFRIETDVDVGQVTMVHIEQDGTGERPSWFLEEVTVGQEAYVGIVRVALETLDGVEKVEIAMEATGNGEDPGTISVFLTAPMKPQTLIDIVQGIDDKYRCGLSARTKGQPLDEEEGKLIKIVVDGLMDASRGDAKFFCRKWLDVTRDDLQTSRFLTPFRPPVDATLRPARLSEFIILKDTISKVDDIVSWIDLLLTVQRKKLEKEIAADIAMAEADAEQMLLDDTAAVQRKPQPEPEAEAEAAAGSPADVQLDPQPARKSVQQLRQERQLKDQRHRQRKAALAKLRAAAHTDMQTLEALSRSAKLVLDGLEPDSKAVKPTDTNKDDLITWNEILGALHRDRRGLRKLVEEWENGQWKQLESSEGEGNAEEGTDSYGLEGWKPCHERMVKELSELRSSLIDSLDSHELARWLVKMGFPKGHELIEAIQHADAQEKLEPVNGKTLREVLGQGGFELLLERIPKKNAGGAGSSSKEQPAGAQLQSALRRPVIISPSDAFDHLLACSSSALLRKKGRELQTEWMDQVGCLDGTSVLPTDDTGDDAGGAGADTAAAGEIEEMKAMFEGLGLGAFCDPVQNATSPHASIRTLRALGVPEMAALADELGMDAGEVLRLSRQLRRPLSVKPCRYCKQVRRHSSHESWQEALAGTVDGELPKAAAAGGQPKWAARFERIQHWFNHGETESKE